AHLKRYQQHASRNFTLSFNSNETAVNLSEWAAMGDWRLFFANRDSVKNLTLNAVGQARRFLQASNRTLGYFLPTDQPARVSIATHTGLTERLQNYEAVRSLPQGERFAATWPEIIARTETFQLSNGLKVAILPKQSRGAPVSMVLNVSLRHDPSLRQQKVALRWLPELMVLGTEKLDNAAFDDALAGHQAYIQGQSEWNLEDPGRMRLAALTVGEHSSAVLDLLLDTLQAPRLAAEEWRLLKAEALSALKEEQQDPSALAWREHLRSMAPYRDDDPRSIPSLQKEYDELEAMPLTLIQKTQASLLQYGEAQLVIIGAVNPRDIKAQLERRLARWKPQPEIHFEHFAYFESQGRQLILPTPDKKGAQIVAGLPLSLRDDDPDYPALKLGALIWGGTMGSRLVQRLRHHDGLSYGADGEFNPGIQSSFGTFSSSAMCAPQNVARAIQGLHEELDRLLGQGITTQELSEARNAYLAQRKQALSDDSNLLELILKNLQINRPLDFEAAFDQKLEQVQAVDIQTALKKWIKPEQLILIQALDQALVGQAS
ncbi:MAG TPA: pitrilysin family protein, partial [Oligoflexus sp.]|uniref:M16 family metallopeptidase n=1 Tax=Oligoflexus sp. TaxID=1971216 RepID=UPI002D74A1C8